MEGSRLVPSVRGMPRGVKVAWLIFAFAVCSVFAFVVYAERAEAIESRSQLRSFDGGICVKGISTFRSHVGTATTQSLDYSNCSSARYKPKGSIATRAILYYYNFSYGQWFACRDTGWKYNTVQAYSWLVQAYRCGPDLYQETWAYGGVLSNGAWRYYVSPAGAPLKSGYEYTPTAAIAASTSHGGEAKETSTSQGKGAEPNDPPPRPPWVRADGTIDKSQMPDCMPVGGSDGKPVMKNGKPHCIPKDELLDEPDPNVSGKKPKKIDATNRKNAEEAEEALEGDSANSLGDDDEEDPITEGKVIVEQGGAAAPK